jgi:Putative porin
MKTLFIAAVFLVSLPCAFAAPADELDLNFGLLAESAQSSTYKTVFAGVTIEPFYRHIFDENFEARLDLVVELLQGSAVGIIPIDDLGQNGPRNDLRLREALGEWHSQNKDISLKLGAINQSSLDNPLFANDIAFVGLQESIGLPLFSGTFEFMSEQATTPSSTSLLQSAQEESLPTFWIAQVGYETSQKAQSHFKIFAAYFDFNDMSTGQAQQSLFFGNTVTGDSTAATFYLPYRGLEGGIMFDYRWNTQWKSTLGLNGIKNTAAPSGSNIGQLVRAGMEYTANEKSILTEVDYFNDQSDTSPALFTDVFLNSKDRQGIAAGVTYKKEQKYSVYARWVHSNPLVEQVYISNEDKFLIGLDMHYGIL